MAKRYTEELAEWVKKREAARPRQDRNAVAFLAVRADIEAAIDAGYALKTVWEHLHEIGKISFRYETFLNHVHRHITRRPTNRAKPATPAKPRATEPKRSEAPGVGGFIFDPSPNKEDLL